MANNSFSECEFLFSSVRKWFSGEPNESYNHQNTSTNNDTTQSNSTHESTTRGILSDDAYLIFTIVVSELLCGFVSLLGITSNSICIVVFKRQGLKDSVNVSLMGLAVADLCCVTIMLWATICNALYLTLPPDFLFDPLSLLLMTGGYPRLIFTKLTCWMTAFISIERCLCVAVPFMVKRIFTPKRTTCVIVSILIMIITGYTTTIYYARTFISVTDTNLNKTWIIMATLTERLAVVDVIYPTFFIFLPVINIIVVVLCTTVLILKLKISVKWREEVTSEPTPGNQTMTSSKMCETSGDTNPYIQTMTNAHRFGIAHLGIAKQRKQQITKEARVTKMISVVTTIFIICNLPSYLLLTISNFVPGFQDVGVYKNLFLASNSLAFLLETISSSVNVIVYYLMSSKFKAELVAMFPFLFAGEKKK